MTTLPTGTVTFLFTDIEGSSRRWESDPSTMRAAVARHDELLASAIESAGGYVFKTVGDGFCAAFKLPTQALTATIAGQRALRTEEFPTATRLMVRMAIHTGVVELCDGDYLGPPVNRCARIIDLAHGGQVLLSNAALALLRDEPPIEATFEDLGEHRLRDLNRPEHLWQVVHPELLKGFPPLRSLDAMPHNLPIRRSRFVGRRAEMEKIAGLLSETRALTLTGTGGTGKTRLALQVAADKMPTWPDGAWFVDLAPLSDGGQVMQAIASALQIREEAGASLAHTVVHAISDRRLLLVLDNCEHLVATCAPLVDDILSKCAHVSILATSRESLGVEGEVVWLVPGLDLR